MYWPPDVNAHAIPFYRSAAMTTQVGTGCEWPIKAPIHHQAGEVLGQVVEVVSLAFVHECEYPVMSSHPVQEDVPLSLSETGIEPVSLARRASSENQVLHLIDLLLYLCFLCLNYTPRRL